ncbi:LPXTG cell wall anchor domain-containing protein [Hymenobacter bucti]|uniref:LPXTG cell wall anchor domain-containing protein n=1 Tax=Hymenobacter bucti TaxID=1844114 RepID=A0ABW4QXL9_9BACT
MRHYLLLGIGLVLASCAAQKALPQYSPQQQAAQRESISYWQPDSAKAIPKLSPAAQRKLDARRRRGQAPAPLLADGGQRALDSVVAVPPTGAQPGRSTAFWHKLNPFRSKQPAAQPLTQQAAAPNIPRKCKGCTFNVVAGNQTNQQTGKKSTAALGGGATATVIEKKAGPTIVASDSSTQNALLRGGNLAAVRGNGNTLPQTATTQHASDWKAELAKPAGQVAATAVGLALLAGAGYLFFLWRKKKAVQNLV